MSVHWSFAKRTHLKLTRHLKKRSQRGRCSSNRETAVSPDRDLKKRSQTLIGPLNSVIARGDGALGAIYLDAIDGKGGMRPPRVLLGRRLNLTRRPVRGNRKRRGEGCLLHRRIPRQFNPHLPTGTLRVFTVIRISGRAGLPLLIASTDAHI